MGKWVRSRVDDASSQRGALRPVERGTMSWAQGEQLPENWASPPPEGPLENGARNLELGALAGQQCQWR
eukprot:3078102-Pyramimonas_sp.AAC.1